MVKTTIAAVRRFGASLPYASKSYGGVNKRSRRKASHRRVFSRQAAPADGADKGAFARGPP